MAVEVSMPKFGLTMQEGIIKQFFKQAGENVKEGEPLYEVETEKVLNEVPAPASGVLAAVLFEVEATVECGRVIAVIAQAGEDPAAVRAKYAGGAGGISAPAAPLAASSAAGNGPASAPEGAAAASGGRVMATPIARKLAGELKVDLSAVKGSGPGGRITREDVEAAAQAKPAAPAAPPAAPAAPPAATKAAPAPAAAPAAAPKAGERIALRGMRKVIADRMFQSLHESAQLTVTTEADVTPATELKTHLGQSLSFTYTDLMIQAVSRALRHHPRINARLGEGVIELLTEINVGFAVALDEGLIVPVVHQADRKSLAEIAAETKVLVEKARAGKLSAQEVSGGTFTISNLGAFGIDGFTPILNPGEAAILGTGRIAEKPVVHRGEIARRSVMTLSLTFDHRIFDGVPAARFLQTLIETFNYGER